ncbi:hypothetical protein ACW9IK_10910 [Pseudomonas gingeri]|nr:MULTISPECIES: hypothetical protein [Pseudomonas]BBP76809.1 hypothetical protein PHLH7_29130 [Pseudomonas sp. Ost2]
MLPSKRDQARTEGLMVATLTAACPRDNPGNWRPRLARKRPGRG